MFNTIAGLLFLGFIITAFGVLGHIILDVLSDSGITMPWDSRVLKERKRVRRVRRRELLREGFTPWEADMYADQESRELFNDVRKKMR